MDTRRTESHRDRRTGLLFLVFLMLLAVCPAARAAEHSHEGWTPWGGNAGETAKLPTETGSYYLTADVSLSAQQTIASGKDVTLCLNGHSVTVTGAVTGICINGGTLNLYDCGTDEHRYSISNGLAVIGSGDKTFTGGYITHTPGKQGIAVDNNGGTFNLYGGTIIGHQTGSYTGTVYNQSGTFNMYGGRIAGNKAVANPYEGSAVFNRGTFNLFDGTICDNTSIGYGGGVGNKKILNMSGGVIRDNHCSRSGAGIYSYFGTVTITGGTISGNITDSWGGGIYLDEATLVLQGGEITGNKAKTTGGVHIAPDSSCVMTGGRITNNSAAEVGGICNNGKLTLSGGVITGNTAQKYGGGIAQDCDAVLYISGNPQVIGNTDGTNPSNIEMYNDGKDAYVTVTGDLTGAKIGVSMLINPVSGTPLLIGKDYQSFHSVSPDTYFFSDRPGYDVILIGKDAVLAARCSLTFNANGASGTAPAGGTFTHGTAITMPGAGSLKMTGHALAGWGREPQNRRRELSDGDIGFYAPGETFIIDGDTTLYAQWDAGRTVTWKNGDGTVLDQKIWKDGDPAPTTEKVPTKAEDGQNTYTFSGWDGPATDGDGNMTYTPRFTAREKETGATAAQEKEKPVPQTGDSEDPLLLTILLLVCVGIPAMTLLAKFSLKKKK